MHPAASTMRFGAGCLLVAISRGDYWQCAYHIPKGSSHETRWAGLPAFRQSVARLVPEFADRLDELDDWEQIKLLTVTLDRLDCWHRPGFALATQHMPCLHWAAWVLILPSRTRWQRRTSSGSRFSRGWCSPTICGGFRDGACFRPARPNACRCFSITS